jgi:type II secretory pathway component PulM
LGKAKESMVKERLQLFWQLRTRERRIEEAAVVALFLGEAEE